jgi:serine/threonine protein kinase
MESYLPDLHKRGIVIDKIHRVVLKMVSEKEYLFNKRVKELYLNDKLHFVMHYEKAYKLDSSKYVLVFKFIEHDLDTLNLDKLKSWDVLGIIYSVVFGIMEFASRTKSMHMDLKPDNIRIVESPVLYHVKLSSPKLGKTAKFSFTTRFLICISDFGESDSFKSQNFRNKACLNFFDLYKFFNIWSVRYALFKPFAQLIHSVYCPRSLTWSSFKSFVQDLSDTIGSPPLRQDHTFRTINVDIDMDAFE